MDLTPYIKAGYPIIYLITPEETRAEVLILKTAEDLKRKLRVWSVTDGFKSLSGEAKNPVSNVQDALAQAKEALKGGDSDPTAALLKLRDEPADTSGEIIVMRDLHMFLNAPKPIRLVRDMVNIFKKSRKTLIIVSPIQKIPPELERDVTIIELPLPSKEELRITFEALYSPSDPLALSAVRKAVGEISADEQEKIIQVALGMTFAEAQNAFAKALVEFGTNKSRALSKLVMQDKILSVKKSGILEYFEPTQKPEDIGGLANLKSWIKLRSKVFTSKAREFNLPQIKGILLAGPPGTGKSLVAKAASHILGVPLLKFDIGKVYGSLVGDSERNMRTALQTAEMIGSCVLFVDEIEKAFAGMRGTSTGDSGTSQRVFGQFLTWMQEKTTPCFIIATVNRIESLPMELLRKGRFDEIFFVSLPNVQERQQIFRVHLRLKNQTIQEDSLLFQECLRLSEGFSGAEIEGAIISAIYEAFDQDRRINEQDLLAAVTRTNPLSQSRSEELQNMIEWAKINAVNAS